jgi:uncharacterized delta-60 repeat protein
MPRNRLRVERLEDRATPAFGLDPTFGTGGQVITAPDAGVAGAVEFQDDGRVLTLGWGYDPTRTPDTEWLELRRLNADGTEDATFGTGGRVTFGEGLSNVYRRLVLDVGPDGAIYAAAGIGQSDADATVFRFTSTGALDPTFGVNGAAAFDFPGGANSYVTDLKGMADGRVVVVGDAVGQSDVGFAAARLNADGTPDATFGGDGFARFEFGAAFRDGSAEVRHLEVTDDGKVLVAGSAGPLVIPEGWVPPEGWGEGNVGWCGVGMGPMPYYDQKPVVVRFNADGSADTSFDTDGAWFYGENGSAGLLGNSADLADVEVQADGKVLLVASVYPNDRYVFGEQDTVVVRLNTDGTLDTAFGTDGVAVALADSWSNGADRMAVMADGRIVVVSPRVQRPIGVAILSAVGVVEDAFLGGESLFTLGFGGDFSGQDPYFTAWLSAPEVAVGPDGRIAVTGVLDPTPQHTNSATRYGVAILADRADALPDDPNPPVDTTPPVVEDSTPPADAQSLLTYTDPNPPLPPVGRAVIDFENHGRLVYADVNGDGVQDRVSVTAPGEPVRVSVVSGASDGAVLVAPFDPFGGDFTGGGFLAAADLDGDGYPEFVVSPDEGGGPRVTVLAIKNGTATVRQNFYGIDDVNFRGGVRIAVGDVDADGTPDLAVTAGFLGGPRTAVFDGTTVLTTPTRLVADFFAFPGADADSLRNGAFVSLGDVDGDGHADFVFGGGPGGAARVYILNGATVAAGDVAAAHANPLANFFVAGNTTDRGGVRVSAHETDGDAFADVAVTTGPTQLRFYRGKNFAGAAEPTAFEDVDLSGRGVTFE